jgi:hypothetical protein
MKKYFVFLILGSLIFSITGFANAGVGDDDKNPKPVPYSKFLKDYKIAKKEFDRKSGKLIDFYMDLQLGYGVTGASVTKNSTSRATGDYDTRSKGGMVLGALVFFNLFDKMSLSSGLSLTNKKFEMIPPAPTGTTGTNNPVSNVLSNNFLNIPLNINVPLDFGDWGITFNGGPYLGINTSKNDPNNSPGVQTKNFDFGLNGTISGNYKIAPLLSVILGYRFEYGGLNNLGSSEFVDKFTTHSSNFFTGLRVGF